MGMAAPVGIGWVYDDRPDILLTTTDQRFMMEYLFRHPDPATVSMSVAGRY